jgi:trehalose 6-phosphate synthase
MTILRAITVSEDERRSRMKALRKRVEDYDVQRWAFRYLEALAKAPLRPHRPTRASDEERRGVDQAKRADLRRRTERRSG